MGLCPPPPGADTAFPVQLLVTNNTNLLANVLTAGRLEEAVYELAADARVVQLLTLPKPPAGLLTTLGAVQVRM